MPLAQCLMLFPLAWLLAQVEHRIAQFAKAAGDVADCAVRTGEAVRVLVVLHPAVAARAIAAARAAEKRA